MFWDAKKLDDERKKREDERRDRERQARLDKIKERKALELKKQRKAEEEKQRREEEEAEAKKHEQAANPQQQAKAPVLNRGFGFGGGDYQSFKSKLSEQQTLQQPGRPHIGPPPPGSRPAAPKADTNSSTNKGSATPTVSLRRPI